MGEVGVSRGMARDLIGGPAHNYCSINECNWSFSFEANFHFAARAKPAIVYPIMSSAVPLMI